MLITNSLTSYERALFEWRQSWIMQARPDQLAPRGSWTYWANICGRGWGKTRVGAEDSGYFAAANPGVRIAVVAPTQDDCRSVCFEGESGLLAVIPPELIARNGFSRQLLELRLKNGSLIAGKSAEKPDRLRGPQWHRAWCDELASWGASAAGEGERKKAAEGGKSRLQATWDNLMFGLRLGAHPKVVITTTPRPLDFLRKMARDKRTHLTTGNTFENEANLAATTLQLLRDVFDGTRKGRQELYAEILEAVEGALWSQDLIDSHRIRGATDRSEYTRIVVAIDPAVTSEDHSDETGIIVEGRHKSGEIHVLEDSSGTYAPHEWARAALSAYSRWQANTFIAEVNQGGDLVESNLRAEANGISFAYKGVRAKRGKYLRAEPVSSAYQKGRIKHVGHFAKLEKQMTSFAGSTGEDSPDRLDAHVYGATELLAGGQIHVLI